MPALQHGSVTEAYHSIIIGCQVYGDENVLTETSEISLMGSCWMNVLGICLTVIAAAVVATVIESWRFQIYMYWYNTCYMFTSEWLNAYQTCT